MYKMVKGRSSTETRCDLMIIPSSQDTQYDFFGFEIKQSWSVGKNVIASCSPVKSFKHSPQFKVWEWWTVLTFLRWVQTDEVLLVAWCCRGEQGPCSSPLGVFDRDRALFVLQCPCPGGLKRTGSVKGLSFHLVWSVLSTAHWSQLILSFDHLS